MKKTLFLIAALFLVYVSKAQQVFQPGYAILTDGTRVAGMILLDDAEPWYNQRHIWLKT